MRGIFQVFTVFSSIFGGIGVVVNFVICLMYYKNPQLLDAPNIFILSIAVGDFGHSMVALPLLAWSNALGEWQFGAAGCTTYGLTTALFGLGSMTNLAGAAYERHIAFKRLLDNHVLQFSKRKALFITMLLWCYALFWSLMPVLGWSSYAQEGIGTSCAVNWKSKDASDVSFALCLILACFLLPVAVIIYCYYKSYQATAQLAQHALQNWGENDNVTQGILEAEREVAWIAVAMTVGFLFAWTPYAVSTLVAIINPDLVSDIAASIPAYIAKSSACYNPFINVYMNRKLRQKLVELLQCCKMNQVHPDPTGSA